MERNKPQKISKPILSDRIGKIYTKPFNARTKYALSINNPIEKKYCQKISNLETNISRLKNDFFQKEFKNRLNNQDNEKSIGLKSLNFVNKKPSYITIRAKKDIDQKHKTNEMFGARKKVWKQSLENQAECTMTPFKECKNRANTNFLLLTHRRNRSIKNKDPSFKTFDIRRRIERETENIADIACNQERIQNKKKNKVDTTINKKYPLAVKITSSGTIQDRLNKPDKIKNNSWEQRIAFHEITKIHSGY